MIKNFILFFSILSILFLKGCSSKSVGLLPKDEMFISTKKSEMALVVGCIEEKSLINRYVVYVLIQDLNKIKQNNNMLLTTNIMFYEPDFSDNFHTKFYFVFQVPEGKYQIKRWAYKYPVNRIFKKSNELNPPIIYKFEKGKIYYIGHFYADDIKQSLTLEDNFNKNILAIKNKYINFPKKNIINLSQEKKFKDWKLTNQRTNILTID